MKSSIASVSLLALSLTACGTAATNASGDLANAPAATSNGAGEIGGNDQAAADQMTAFPPEAREAWIAAQRRDCREAGERFDERGILFEAFNGRNDSPVPGGANIFRAADFNGDGRPDFIMINNNRGCPASDDDDLGSMGARGFPYDFLISGPQGYRMESDVMIWFDLMATVTRRGDRDVLVVRHSEETAIPRDYGRCGLAAQVVFGWANGTLDAIERRNAQGQLVDRENCVQAAASDGAAPVAPLNIVPGYYVQEDSACGRPVVGVYYYDGRRGGIMYPPDTGPAELMPIGRPVRRGDFWEFDDGSAVRVLAPNRIIFRYEEEGPPMRLCPSDQVPASVRVRG